MVVIWAGRLGTFLVTRIRRYGHDDRFDDPNLPGTMKTTITLKPVLCGTDVSIVQEDLPEVIPVEMCYLGWQESLAQLAMLVEPNIPD